MQRAWSRRPVPQVIRPRVRVGEEVVIGPGKVELLRAVASEGSISAAGRALGMGYKRAWSLLDELQRSCAVPMIETSAGGTGGGGAKVTKSGLALIAHYDELNQACEQAARPALAKLSKLLRR
jgi:molybdate transport system regulatory protein